MNLLLTRSQARSMFFSLIPLRIGGTVTFKLKAELEFTREERTLLRNYSFSNATLVSSNVYDDLARAFKPAWLLGLITMLVTAFVIVDMYLPGFEGIALKILVPPILGILCVIVMTLIYFFTMRRNITVSQLMNGGRTFYCHSVVELDEQEQELNDLSRRLHATLEKAKNWGGREINPIPEGEPFYLPDTEQTKPVSMFEKTAHMTGSILAKKVINKLQPERDVAQQSKPAQPITTQPPKTDTADTLEAPAPAETNKPVTPHPFAAKRPDTSNDGT